MGLIPNPKDILAGSLKHQVKVGLGLEKTYTEQLQDEFKTELEKIRHQHQKAPNMTNREWIRSILEDRDFQLPEPVRYGGGLMNHAEEVLREMDLLVRMDNIQFMMEAMLQVATDEGVTMNYETAVGHIESRGKAIRELSVYNATVEAMNWKDGTTRGKEVYELYSDAKRVLKTYAETGEFTRFQSKASLDPLAELFIGFLMLGAMLNDDDKK